MEKMISSKTKPIIIVFALLLITGLATVGCGQKAKDPWVNTNSMPGNTFVQHNYANKPASTVVYLGSKKSSSNANFGPSDVSFDIHSLR